MSCGGICIFGEVLFDHFPDGKRVLGGAPFNVAWHLQALGESPCFISRVGNDPEGDEVHEAMHGWGMRTDALQTDADLPTGRVSVTFGAGGEPAYDIVEPCAYDAIAPEFPGQACRILYHGTLALRKEASRNALNRLREKEGVLRFVDVNLRPPWWRREDVLAMIDGADWVKINSDELAELTSTGGTAFMAEYRLHGVVLTHGAAGAEVMTADGEHASVQPAGNVDVVDSVGAGDAFASVMILGLAGGWPLPLAAERAQEFASALVGRRGATVHDAAFYRPFIDAWGLEPDHV